MNRVRFECRRIRRIRPFGLLRALEVSMCVDVLLAAQ